MKHKPALILSVVLTVFVIVMLTTVVSSAKGLIGSIGGQTENVSQSEQAYIDALNAANQQISDLQMQLNGTNPEAITQETAITAEMAVQIATAAAMDGYQLSGEPELVDLDGVVAYEVPLDDSFIYVDAASGEVLFNGTIPYGPQQIVASEAARIASNYLNRQDVTGVSLASLNGQQVFRVTFANQDVVYVSQYGVLLQVQLASSSTASTSRTYHDDDENEHEYEDNDD